MPTRTLRSLLGKALQGQSDDVKLEFFNALSRPEETRQAASFILNLGSTASYPRREPYSANGQGAVPVPPRYKVTKLIPATQIAPESEEPPYYWVSPKNFPGIDSALVFKKEIIAFQVTPRPEHESPIKGLSALRENLPDNLKDVRWKVVFNWTSTDGNRSNRRAMVQHIIRGKWGSHTRRVVCGRSGAEGCHLPGMRALLIHGESSDQIVRYSATSLMSSEGEVKDDGFSVYVTFYSPSLGPLYITLSQ